ncbi:MAG TPA: YgiQ family radical SAM protein [Thermodesulfobacteriaceae bacterium]|nr:YgiQ family radical SAM protein [Thermodesulfobacteriaceae bacterium]
MKLKKNTTCLQLPACREEMRERRWENVDVVLVSGDAYIDHPSFGTALISRWLEAHGFRVAILAQPRHDSADDFLQFGRPRLFFGISAGNMDSIVSNYTGYARVRSRDVYSPEGNPYFGAEKTRTCRRRPDRATIRYAHLARQAYRDVPIVLGGIEASLRRFVHYDYQQEKLRASVLTDAKADLLVYGMGERAVLEIAGRLARGAGLAGIPGTCERLSETRFAARQLETSPLTLPSWDSIHANRERFLDAELALDAHARSFSMSPVVQKQQSMWVLQNRPAGPLTRDEFDRIGLLPFTRRPHPSAGDVPAYRMVRHSINIVRGCFGNCSFCAIARHQGPVIVSKSPGAVVKEAGMVAEMPDFRGTITDLGGPTANMYGAGCRLSVRCRRHDCLFPRVCRHLDVDDSLYDLILRVERITGVRRVFISSGLRMELLLGKPRLLQRLLQKNISGSMKIAPEHTESFVLHLMHKSGYEVLRRFLEEAGKISRKAGMKPRFTPYFISAHPGCSMDHMKKMAGKIKNLGLYAGHLQDFTPTPGTVSTAMYVTGLHRDTREPIQVARTRRARRAQRRILEGLMRG